MFCENLLTPSWGTEKPPPSLASASWGRGSGPHHQLLHLLYFFFKLKLMKLTFFIVFLALVCGVLSLFFFVIVSCVQNVFLFFFLVFSSLAKPWQGSSWRKSWEQLGQERPGVSPVGLVFATQPDFLLLAPALCPFAFPGASGTKEGELSSLTPLG